ncbi:hypothetical protein PGT21_037058 [Puccinia graminis f. sp. tritici]|uniref:Uncharacterized protein n=1 Tax=Puccinia graminis f. sp. tritici TaxID=56615 RepID=A0A5B0R3F3_PUCGR|nr:hypothetical protein PGT21_037058 [Puccinia graminis f. sp. tritici]
MLCNVASYTNQVDFQSPPIFPRPHRSEAIATVQSCGSIATTSPRTKAALRRCCIQSSSKQLGRREMKRSQCVTAELIVPRLVEHQQALEKALGRIVPRRDNIAWWGAMLSRLGAMQPNTVHSR